MRKLIYFGVFTSLLLASCQPEEFEPNQTDDDITTLSNEDVLLKELIMLTEDGPSTAYFEYEGKKIISKTYPDVKSFTYEYTGDLITKITFQSFDSPDHKYEQYYQYDGNNRVSQMTQLTYYGPNSPKGDKYVFTHNSDNTISYEKYTGTLTEQEDYIEQGTYYLNSDNEVYKYEQNNTDGEFILKVNYTFDMKKSPYKNIVGYSKLFYLNGAENSQNLLTTEMESANGTTVINYMEYEYNEDEYPISSEMTITSDSEPYGTNSYQYVYY